MRPAIPQARQQEISRRARQPAGFSAHRGAGVWRARPGVWRDCERSDSGTGSAGVVAAAARDRHSRRRCGQSDTGSAGMAAGRRSCGARNRCRRWHGLCGSMIAGCLS